MATKKDEEAATRKRLEDALRNALNTPPDARRKGQKKRVEKGKRS
jgi:hypothetical protein